MKENEEDEVETHNEEGTTSGSCCACKVGPGVREGFKCLSPPGPTNGCYEDWVHNASSLQNIAYQKTGVGVPCKGSMMSDGAEGVPGQKFSCWARNDLSSADLVSRFGKQRFEGEDKRSFREQCKNMLMTFPPKRGSLAEVSAHEAVKVQDEALAENAAVEVKTNSKEETHNEEGTTSGACCACKVGPGATEGFTCLRNPGPTTGCYEDWVSNSSSVQNIAYRTTGVGMPCKGWMMIKTQKFACWARDDSVKEGEDKRPFIEQCKSVLMSFPAKKGSLAEVSAHEALKVQNLALARNAAVEVKTDSKEAR